MGSSVSNFSEDAGNLVKKKTAKVADNVVGAAGTTQNIVRSPGRVAPYAANMAISAYGGPLALLATQTGANQALGEMGQGSVSNVALMRESARGVQESAKNQAEGQVDKAAAALAASIPPPIQEADLSAIARQRQRRARAGTILTAGQTLGATAGGKTLLGM